MERRGFLLLVGLFVLVAAACATTSSTPSLTASGSPKDEQSASAAATATPDDQYQVLIGEWRGRFKKGGIFKSGFVGTLKILEIDIAKTSARCTYDISGSDIRIPTWQNMPIQAYFVPGPSPTLRWFSEDRSKWEFVLKNNVLEGTLTRYGMFGSPAVFGTITMEKYLNK